MWESFFCALYPLVSIGYIMAYVPQIKALIYSKSNPDGLSLAAWWMWLCCNFISLGYGFFHLRDNLLCLTTLISTFLICTIIGLILYNRKVRFAVRRSLGNIGLNSSGAE